MTAAQSYELDVLSPLGQNSLPGDASSVFISGQSLTQSVRVMREAIRGAQVGE